jgi:hypothetical protein
VRVVDDLDRRIDRGQDRPVVRALAAAVREHVRHHGAQPAVTPRDPRPVRGEHPAGHHVVEVPERLGRPGGVDRAARVDLERGMIEERIVDGLELVERVASQRDDPVEDREPLVVRALRRVLEVRDLALVVRACLVRGCRDGRANDQQVAVDIAEHGRNLARNG